MERGVPAALPPGNDSSVPFGCEAEWTSESVWTPRRWKPRIVPSPN